MGIDYGKKRVGIALSDTNGRVAFPEVILKNDASFMSSLIALIEEKNVEVIVLGHSKKLNGEDNDIQASINELMTDLTLEIGLPVHLEAEFFSTQEAKRWQGKTDLLDAQAAAIILDRYLVKQT